MWTNITNENSLLGGLNEAQLETLLTQTRDQLQHAEHLYKSLKHQKDCIASKLSGTNITTENSPLESLNIAQLNLTQLATLLKKTEEQLLYAEHLYKSLKQQKGCIVSKLQGTHRSNQNNTSDEPAASTNSVENKEDADDEFLALLKNVQPATTLVPFFAKTGKGKNKFTREELYLIVDLHRFLLKQEIRGMKVTDTRGHFFDACARAKKEKYQRLFGTKLNVGRWVKAYPHNFLLMKVLKPGELKKQRWVFAIGNPLDYPKPEECKREEPPASAVVSKNDLKKSKKKSPYYVGNQSVDYRPYDFYDPYEPRWRSDGWGSYYGYPRCQND